VGARVGGVPDAVWDEETGLLVPPDAPLRHGRRPSPAADRPRPRPAPRRTGPGAGAHRSQLGPRRRPYVHAAQPGGRLSTPSRLLRQVPRLAPPRAFQRNCCEKIGPLSGPYGPGWLACNRDRTLSVRFGEATRAPHRSAAGKVSPHAPAASFRKKGPLPPAGSPTSLCTSSR
jgi:hypothetical protein